MLCNETELHLVINDRHFAKKIIIGLNRATHVVGNSQKMEYSTCP